MFEFFCFGQSGAGPANIAANAEVNQEINDNDNGIGPNDQPMAEGWGYGLINKISRLLTIWFRCLFSRVKLSWR